MAVIGNVSVSYSATVPSVPSIPQPTLPPLTPPPSMQKPPTLSWEVGLSPNISRQFAVSTLAAGSVIPKNVTLAKASLVDFAKPNYNISDGLGADPAEFWGDLASPAPIGMTRAQAEAAGTPWALIAAGLGALVVVGVVVAKKRKKR